MSLKRQRRLIKYQQDILQCGDDAQALTRFVAAQTEAFRKILKKYKVWFAPRAAFFPQLLAVVSFMRKQHELSLVALAFVACELTAFNV